MKKLLFIALAAVLIATLTSCGSFRNILYILFGDGTETELPFETEVFVPDTGSQDEFSPRTPADGMPYYDTVTRYAWLTLTGEQRGYYYDVLEAALAFRPSVTLPEGADAAFIWECVFFDTPELFYLDERADVSGGVLKFRYAFTREKAAELAQGLDREYKAFLSCTGAGDGACVYDKVISLYEYIINKTKYKDSADDDYEKDIYNEDVYRAISAIGPLIDGQSICIGYARATQYLALRLGIQTFTVKGSGDSGPHYYSLVLFDDGYYYVDTTWGDPVGSDRSVDYLTYYYFGMTTEELLRSHFIRTHVSLPVCTATKYNYFIYNGLTANSAGEIAAKAFDGYEKGEMETLLKVRFGAIETIYDEMWDAMSKEAKARGIDDVSYGLIKATAPGVIGVVFH